MIISHKYKFIFIKTLKTAGTSIEVFLSRLCDDADVVTPIWPQEPGHRARNHQGKVPIFKELGKAGMNESLRTVYDALTLRKFYNHIPAWKVHQRVSRNVWNDYFKFCVERNPWDKTISHYYTLKNMPRKRRLFSSVDPNLDFDQYLRNGNFCLNYPLYTEPNDPKKIMVDRVARYENLNHDLKDIFDKLGIPFEGDLGIKAKGGFREDRRPYQALFDHEAKKVIERAFAPEIGLHGYTFETKT